MELSPLCVNAADLVQLNQREGYATLEALPKAVMYLCDAILLLASHLVAVIECEDSTIHTV